MAATLASLWERKKKLQPNHTSPAVDLTAVDEHMGTADATCKAFRTSADSDTVLVADSRDRSMPADDAGQSQPMSAQDKKRKRAQLSAEQLHVLEGLWNVSNDPSDTQIHNTVRMEGMSEQLVRDFVDQKRKAKAQRATAWSKASHVTLASQHSTGAACTDSSEAMLVQTAEQLETNSFAAANPGLEQHHAAPEGPDRPATQNCGRPDGSQQVLKASAETTASANQTKLTNSDSQMHEHPEHGYSSVTKIQLLRRYQSELQSCMQQSRMLQQPAAVPQFTDGQLSRPEASWLLHTSACCMPCLHP